jgi:hypothetical protein
MLARWPRAHRWRRDCRDRSGRGPAASAVIAVPAVIVVTRPARDARLGGTP